MCFYSLLASRCQFQRNTYDSSRCEILGDSGRLGSLISSTISEVNREGLATELVFLTVDGALNEPAEPFSETEAVNIGSPCTSSSYPKP